MQDYKARKRKKGVPSFRRRPDERSRRRPEVAQRAFRPLGKPTPRQRPARRWSAALSALRAHPWQWAFGAAVLWLCLGLAGGAAALWRAPLESVTIAGRHRLSEAELIRAAGLQAGLALRSVDPYETARRLAAHPWVRRADARRVFPDRLAITVQERVPALRVALADGRLATVDADGVVLSIGGADAARTDLPLVTGVQAPAEPGQALDDPALSRATRALTALAAQTPVGEAAPAGPVEVDAGDPFLLRLRLGDGRELVMPPRRVGAALQAYETLLPHLAELAGGRNTVDFSAMDADGGGRIILRRDRTH